MPDTATIKMKVNGRDAELTIEGERSLLEILREDLALSGTKYGCGDGDCGACSVLVDGKRIFSCKTPVSRMAGKSITTIEGLANGDTLHPVQQAFLDEGAFQCGYCTPGMIVTAAALLGRTPNPSDEEVCDGMNGNICRCCGYENIKNAVKRAAQMTPVSERTREDPDR